MRFKPEYGRILIKKLPMPEGATETGLAVPGDVRGGKDLRRGEVISDGGGLDPISGQPLPKYKKGTIIWYDEYSCQRVIDEKGRDFYVLAKDDVIIIEELG